MKIKLLFIALLASTLFVCCKERGTAQQFHSEEYNEADYNKFQGIVLKKVIRYKRGFFDSYKKGDIYYIYNLSLDEPQIGIEKNSDLSFNDGDIVMIMVHKKDSTKSFIGHRGIIDQKLLEQYLRRNDSNYYKMKNLESLE